MSAKKPATKESTPTRALERVGRVSSASVEKGSGRGWDEWVRVLDKAGARGWTHQEIVAYLRKKHRLSLWWQQGVTLGYEIAIGRRIEGRTLKGELTTTSTKTVPITASAAWRLFFSEEGLACWLKPLSGFELKAKAQYEAEGGVFGEVRTFLAGRRARLSWREDDWEKATILQIGVIPRPNGKSLMMIQHDGIKDARVHEALRQRWQQALSDLLILASSEHARSGDPEPATKARRRRTTRKIPKR